MGRLRRVADGVEEQLQQERSAQLPGQVGHEPQLLMGERKAVVPQKAQREARPSAEPSRQRRFRASPIRHRDRRALIPTEAGQLVRRLMKEAEDN